MTFSQCLGGGMVDAADSKSAVRKDVRVRVSPEAPIVKLFEPTFPELFMTLKEPQAFACDRYTKGLFVTWHTLR
jgi:hypothetical protein